VQTVDVAGVGLLCARRGNREITRGEKGGMKTKKKKLTVFCDFKNQLRTFEGDPVCQDEHFENFEQVLKFLKENKGLYEFLGMTTDTKGGEEIREG